MKLLAKLLVTAVSLLGVAAVIPGIEVSGFYIALIVAIILGLINLIVRPLLLLLTLPINLLTFGLFTFVINGLLFLFVSSFVDGFEVSGFGVAIIGALLVSAFSWMGDKVVEAID